MIIKKFIPNFIKKIYTNIIYCWFLLNNKMNVMEDDETINCILKKSKSVVRFGDGEFKWMLKIKQESFQTNSNELADKLSEILKNKDKRILVCIPEAFNNTKKYTKSTKMFWRTFIRWEGNKITPYLDKKYKYGNACFTRWYLEYKNKENASERIKKLKQIWNNKDILIIEGKDTKLGVGNDLFDNCKSIKRILAPSKNAFNSYQLIYNEAKSNNMDNRLVLIALGPTATVLAYDLAMDGYQALDIGHIDIEYEWYLRKTKTKIMIPGKYVNEAGGMNEIDKIQNLKYSKEIIKVIGEDK